MLYYEHLIERLEERAMSRRDCFSYLNSLIGGMSADILFGNSHVPLYFWLPDALVVLVFIEG